MEVAVRCLDARAVLGGQSRGGDGLHCKRTVPELAAVVTLRHAGGEWVSAGGVN